MADRKEWLDLKARKAAERPTDTLQVLVRAAVNAATLTGSPQWDEYLSYLQAEVEKTQVARQGLVDLLTSDSAVQHGNLVQLKLAIARCDERIMAWTAAMELPNAIKQGGEQAKAVLARMEKVVA